MDEGIKIARTTSEPLQEDVESSREVADIIYKISESAKEQADASALQADD